MVLSSPQVNSLVYWENPRDSGIVCGAVLVCLLAVRYISLISVVGNLSLALVTATTSFRIYKAVLAAVNKSQEGHPFKQFLALDLSLPADKVSQLTEGICSTLNNVLSIVKSAILVDNLMQSLKFALAMYLLSYLGLMFNGLTLVTLLWVGVFSLPRLYRDNQTQVDEALLPLKSKLDELQAKVGSVIPASISGAKKEE